MTPAITESAGAAPRCKLGVASMRALSGSRQHTLDVPALQLFQRQAARDRRRQVVLGRHAALANGLRQILGLNQRTLCQRHVLAGLGRAAGQEVLGERQDVLGAVAQRGQVDVDDIHGGNPA